VEWNDGKGYSVPALEHELLEFEVMLLASRQNTTCIACLAYCSFDEGAEVATALQLVLNPEPPIRAERAGPLGVDLAFEVERPALVGDVTWGDKEGEADPEHERIYGEEGAVVEQYTRPSNKGCDNAKRGSQGGKDELGAITNTHDISMGPDIEPCQQAEYECNEGVDGE